MAMLAIQAPEAEKKLRTTIPQGKRHCAYKQLTGICGTRRARTDERHHPPPAGLSMGCMTKGSEAMSIHYRLGLSHHSRLRTTVFLTVYASIVASHAMCAKRFQPAST